MKTLQERIDELKALAKERDSLDKKYNELALSAVEDHSKYKVGSVHINELKWCYSHMGKKFKVTGAFLQGTSDGNYQWRIRGSILRADGSVGKHSITGTVPIEKEQ